MINCIQTLLFFNSNLLRHYAPDGKSPLDVAKLNDQVGVVQVDPGFPQLNPRVLSAFETKIRSAAFNLFFQLQPAPLHQVQPCFFSFIDHRAPESHSHSELY